MYTKSRTFSVDDSACANSDLEEICSRLNPLGSSHALARAQKYDLCLVFPKTGRDTGEQV